jgi:pyrroloquinoline quinone biosynthesis protein A
VLGLPDADHVLRRPTARPAAARSAALRDFAQGDLTHDGEMPQASTPVSGDRSSGLVHLNQLGLAPRMRTAKPRGEKGGTPSCKCTSTGRSQTMQWIEPAYCDLRLGFEVTAYVYVR